MIKRLWPHLSKLRKRQFVGLVALMLLASLAELASIGSILPFLAVISDPEIVYNNPFSQPLIQALGIKDPSGLLMPITVIFIIAVLTANSVRLSLLYATTRLSYAIGSDISIDIYRRTLYQEYSVHVSRNSSEVINGIIIKTNTVIISILWPSLIFLSSIFLMVGISSILIFINPKVALLSAFIFGLIYIAISFCASKALQKNSKLVARESEQMVKSLQEGLGGIRDVLIDGAQEFYAKIYERADLSLRKAAGDIIFISGSPKYLMEGIGMSLIATLAYFLIREGDSIVSAIPLLGALALGAQRLLPVLQQGYSSYSTIKGAESSFEDILDLLRQPMPSKENQDSVTSLKFNEDIVLSNLSFKYDNHGPWILKNVNLVFKKGEKIGFVGVTGSGKSTLIDILMGLLPPSSGELLIDGVCVTTENRRAWQQLIAHVPQNIYLADSSIRENIAFGIHINQIKEDKIKKVAEQAQIGDLVNQITKEYDGNVGERGDQLSGGQRQRIGIARAMYKDSNVLIFDEATSALDNQTEKKIMQNISALKGDRTTFIIAHRLTTLKECDRIIRINKDYTVDEVNYDEL